MNLRGLGVAILFLGLAMSWVSGFSSWLWLGVIITGIGMTLIITSIFWHTAGWLDNKTQEFMK